MVHRAHTWLSLGLSLGAVHCGPVEDSVEPIATAAGAIAEGYEDTEDVAVVSIVNVQSSLLCSGTLIERNVVLTARHCVSSSNTSAGVFCEGAKFNSPASPAAFAVSTEAVVDIAGQAAIGASAVLVLDDPSFCGGDVAILVLSEPIPSAVAAPITPRLDEPVAPGEEYYAVGFGGIDDSGAEAGVRRRRDDLVVSCVAAGCTDPELPEIRDTEFIGETGVCIGDSGGPAMDLADRVVGVTSRGLAGCDAPVYGSTVAQRSFIEDAAVYGAGAGEYDPPEWAAGSSVDPHASAPVGQACAAPADCYTGLCVGEEGKTFCSRPCADDAPCPGGFACGSDGVCREPPPPTHSFPKGDDGGCATAGGAARGPAGACLVVLLAGVGLFRRRRSQRQGRT